MAKRFIRWFAVAGAVSVPLVLFVVLVQARAQPSDGENLKTVQGRVQSFTTAPRGEVDGAMLDDGTTVHWPPHLGGRIANIVAKGERVRATGWMEAGPAGDTHLEVQTITNLGTNASFDRPDDVLPPRAGSRGPRFGNVEDRLRTLEDRVDQLVKEVERLRSGR